MGPNTSLGAVQWLEVKGESFYTALINNLCFHIANEIAPLQLHSSYYRGEAEINGLAVDGYASDGHNHFIFEYLGCEYHVSP